MIGYPSSTVLLKVLDQVSKKARTARTTTRFGITFVVALMVISSPIVVFINPVLVLAADSPASMMSTPTPSTISQDGGGDFTAQASLAFRSTKQTNNIVNTQSEFAVIFSTGATGVIKTITVTFPAGTIIGSGNLLFDREGIGPGSATRTSSTTITYTVNNAVSVPAGTKIKLEFATIINAPTPGNHQVVVTTRDAADAIIDGPSAIGYTLKQIGTGDIADNAVTTNKIADDAITDAKLSLDSVYTVWEDDTSSNDEILYKRNTVSFDPDVDLSNNAGSSFQPAVAASGNNVYVVWEDNTSGIDEILYRRSTDGGATFGSTINLSNNAGFSLQPAVAASGNNVYVVWQDNTPGNFEILYLRSTDGGATFGSTFNLSNNAGNSQVPSIAVSGNNVYVVWTDSTSGNNEILYRRLTDGGATFDSTINLSNNAGDSTLPAVAASGNNVYVVWQDVTSGNDEILYRRSTDGGATLGSTINLSNNAGSSLQPAVAASGNNVYVVWQDFIGNFEISYRRSTDGGATFGSTINLSNNAGSSFQPAVAASGNNVYVVWTDNTPGNLEILYLRSTDGGATLGSTINLSNNAGDSVVRAVAAVNNLT